MNFSLLDMSDNRSVQMALTIINFNEIDEEK